MATIQSKNVPQMITVDVSTNAFAYLINYNSRDCCYRCGKYGHERYNCHEKELLFCSQCGKLNTKTLHCHPMRMRDRTVSRRCWTEEFNDIPVQRKRRLEKTNAEPIPEPVQKQPKLGKEKPKVVEKIAEPIRRQPKPTQKKPESELISEPMLEKAKVAQKNAELISEPMLEKPKVAQKNAESMPEPMLEKPKVPQKNAESMLEPMLEKPKMAQKNAESMPEPMLEKPKVAQKNAELISEPMLEKPKVAQKNAKSIPVQENAESIPKPVKMKPEVLQNSAEPIPEPVQRRPNTILEKPAVAQKKREPFVQNSPILHSNITADSTTGSTILPTLPTTTGDKRPMTSVIIGYKTFPALLDTGASASLIGSVVIKYCTEFFKLRPKDTIVQMGDGRQLTLKSTIIAPVTINKRELRHEFVCFPQLAEVLILGVDVMNRFGISIKFSERRAESFAWTPTEDNPFNGIVEVIESHTRCRRKFRKGFILKIYQIKSAGIALLKCRGQTMKVPMIRQNN